MNPPLLVTLPEYHRSPVKPRGFKEFCDMIDPGDHGGVVTLWEIARYNKNTHKLLSRLWTANVLTDNGALAMLKNAYANAGGTVSPFNQIALGTGAGSTTLTAALTNGSMYTALSVAALPAQIASGASVVIGYGGGTTQTVVLSATAAQGATSISVVSFTANANYAIGANVVPVPNASDNPSSLTGAVYSGVLGSGAFTYSGSGLGNRQVAIAYTFPTAPTTTAGNYTEAWMTNANPVSAAGQTANHEINPAQAINTVASVTVNIVQKV